MKKEVKYELYLVAAALVILAAVILFVTLSSPRLAPASVQYAESASNKSAELWETQVEVTSVDITRTSQKTITYKSTEARSTRSTRATNAATTKLYGKINVNKATLEELCELSGIGEVTAAKIIEYRQTNGNFTKPEDLLNVKGIGEKKLEAIRDFICF